MTKPKPKTVEQVYHATLKIMISSGLTTHDVLTISRCIAATAIYTSADDQGHGLRTLRDQFIEHLCEHLAAMPHDPEYHDDCDGCEAADVESIPMTPTVVH